MAPAFTEQKMRMASRLFDARKRAGLSQERAAAMVGTSRRHWIRWERGETMPNPLYLERVAEVLNAPELIAADEDEEDRPDMVAVLMPSAALRQLVREEMARA